MNACMKGTWFKMSTETEKESEKSLSGKDFWLGERGVEKKLTFKKASTRLLDVGVFD